MSARNGAWLWAILTTSVAGATADANPAASNLNPKAMAIAMTRGLYTKLIKVLEGYEECCIGFSGEQLTRPRIAGWEELSIAITLWVRRDIYIAMSLAG